MTKWVKFQLWLIRVIMFLVIGAVLYACTGCQTVRGIAADTGRLCRDVQQQIPPRDAE